MSSKHDSFLAEYAETHEKWESFASRLRNLLVDLLNARDVGFHVVEARAKTVESVREKLARPGKSYANPLREIPDLAGVCVVLYDKQAVEAVEALIDSEFDVDIAASSDKLAELAPDQFGYLSVHKVVSLSQRRAAITEWKRFTDLQAEIQIRTVLQHAWASISHKIQYKRESQIPGVIRRRLMRLAGLFELADDEFLALRSRDAELRSQIEESIKTRQDEVPLDLISVEAFAANSDVIRRIGTIANQHGFRAITSSEHPGVKNLGPAQLLEVATAIGCKTITDLESRLDAAAPSAEMFFKELDILMTGTPSHFAAVILIATNPKTFATPDQDPFQNKDYSAAIIDARRKVFQES